MPGGDWGRYDDLELDEGFDHGELWSASAAFGGENLHFNVIKFDPGEGGPLHYHVEPIEEYYFVFEGRLDVRIGDEVVEAEAGSVLFAPPGVLQQPTNTSDEPAWVLSISAPKVDPVTDGVVTVDDE